MVSATIPKATPERFALVRVRAAGERAEIAAAEAWEAGAGGVEER